MKGRTGHIGYIGHSSEIKHKQCSYPDNIKLNNLSSDYLEWPNNKKHLIILLDIYTVLFLVGVSSLRIDSRGCRTSRLRYYIRGCAAASTCLLSVNTAITNPPSKSGGYGNSPHCTLKETVVVQQCMPKSCCY